jgi:type II secretory pathway component GspD/PulD (secretin)
MYLMISLQRSLRVLALAVGASALSASLAVAQSGAGSGGQDSMPTRSTPNGMVLDFVDQDVSVVLRAIAEAGGLSVTLSNMPAARVSVRLQQLTTREAALDALQAVAEGANITLTPGESVIRLVGPPRATPTPRVSAAQQLQQERQNRALNLYTLRLKHSAATEVAPMLMNLLSGAGAVTAPTSTRNTRNNRNGNRTSSITTLQQGGGRTGAAALETERAAVAAERAAVAAQRGAGSVNALGEVFGRIIGAQVAAPQSALAFSDIRIVPDELTNSLIVRATAEDFAAVQQLVQSVDLRPLQVLIEVTIAQVERNSDLNLGLSGSVTRTNGDTSAIQPSASAARDFIFMLTGGSGSVDYDIALNALQTRGNVKVLSLPILIAQNNREAVLNVGSSVPFVQITQAGGFDPNARVQTIQYLPVGKTLTITPTINTDGYVNMDVVQTNNDVSNNLLFDAPIINEREAQTSVFVRDGQTTVIGGLSDNTTDESTSGIPILSRIPLLGWLFGSTRTSNRTTELFLFLTPHIVSSDEDVDRLREAIKESTDMLDGVPVEGRVELRGDTMVIGVPDTLPASLPDTLLELLSGTSPLSTVRSPGRQ